MKGLVISAGAWILVAECRQCLQVGQGSCSLHGVKGWLMFFTPAMVQTEVKRALSHRKLPDTPLISLYFTSSCFLCFVADNLELCFCLIDSSALPRAVAVRADPDGCFW